MFFFYELICCHASIRLPGEPSGLKLCIKHIGEEMTPVTSKYTCIELTKF